MAMKLATDLDGKSKDSKQNESIGDGMRITEVVLL